MPKNSPKPILFELQINKISFISKKNAEHAYMKTFSAAWSFFTPRLSTVINQVFITTWTVLLALTKPHVFIGGEAIENFSLTLGLAPTNWPLRTTVIFCELIIVAGLVACSLSVQIDFILKMSLQESRNLKVSRRLVVSFRIASPNGSFSFLKNSQRHSQRFDNFLLEIISQQISNVRWVT